MRGGVGARAPPTHQCIWVRAWELFPPPQSPSPCRDDEDLVRAWVGVKLTRLRPEARAWWSVCTCTRVTRKVWRGSYLTHVRVCVCLATGLLVDPAEALQAPARILWALQFWEKPPKGWREPNGPGTVEPVPTKQPSRPSMTYICPRTSGQWSPAHKEAAV